MIKVTDQRNRVLIWLSNVKVLYKFPNVQSIPELSLLQSALHSDHALLRAGLRLGRHACPEMLMSTGAEPGPRSQFAPGGMGQEGLLPVSHWVGPLSLGVSLLQQHPLLSAYSSYGPSAASFGGRGTTWEDLGL